MPFTIRDIPTAMRANGWNVGAQLMDRWFAGAARVMSPDEKDGRTASPDQELQLVTMAWGLRFGRISGANSHLISSWHQEPRRAASVRILRDRLQNWRGSHASPAGKPFRFGNLSVATPTVDATCQINFDRVDSSIFGAVDDVYAALGRAVVKLAISGMVTPIAEKKWRVTVDEIGTYIRDTYDFIDDQPLGSWGPAGISRVAFLAPEIPIIAEEPHSDGQGRYFSVNNGSFRRYRNHYRRGGDFVIFSDVRRRRLTSPIIIDITD